MPIYKKDNYGLKILEILGHTSLIAADIFDAMLSGYPRKGGVSKETYKKIHQRIDKRHADLDQVIELAKERHRFASLLSKMRKDGLIEKLITGKKSSFWKRTSEGEEKYFDWSRKVTRTGESYLPPDLGRHYEIQKGKKLIIVIFDIPERERNKRDWLRDVLKNLEFRKIQESVMIGKNKIPIKLLADLKRIRIFECVHFFTITGKGTIDF